MLSGTVRATGADADFTFVHCSDIHVPPGVQRRTGVAGRAQFGSTEVVAQIKSLTSPITVGAYKVTVPAPSFAIVTGDLCEFGGGSFERAPAWWEQYLGLWKDTPFPVFHQSGNHDSTWVSNRSNIKKLYGSPYYSFDRHGAHFIALDSATPQDPRPSFGEEQFQWLKEDLKKISRTTPLFIYCHHPLESKEFASAYERDRLLDLLRPYNLALILVGHGHAPVYRKVDGVDQVMGGSTFGNVPGYSVVSVKDGMLRVAYRRADGVGPEKPLLEKPLPVRPTYPRITISSPADLATFAAKPARIEARIDREDIASVTWESDGEPIRKGELRAEGKGGWSAAFDPSAWNEGCHRLRVFFTARDGAVYRRSVQFYVDGAAPRVKWRARMEGAGKAAPLVTKDLVIAGSQDGYLYAFDRESGKRRWRFKTGGEILAKPLLHEGRIYVGSGDGSLYCVTQSGKRLWSYDTGNPVASAATTAAGRVVVADTNGHIHGLAPRDGTKVWENGEPGYSIESAPAVSGETLYYGCWDGYVYAINASDGRTRWRNQGAGSAASLPGLVRYYSPADTAPVVVGTSVNTAAAEQVWVADRMFRLSVMDAATGTLIRQEPNVVSVARSAGSGVYLRGSGGGLRKVAFDGRTLWTSPARTSVVPTAPVEHGDLVYSVSGTGWVVALNAADGTRRWDYQTTPDAYVFSDPTAVTSDRAGADGVVVTGMDGSVTYLLKGFLGP